MTNADPRPRAVRRGWPVRARLLVALLLVTALGMSVAGATTFLFQRQRVLASLDSTLTSRVTEARAVVLGASNSRSSSAPNAQPQPFTSARAATEAVISRVLPNSDETTLGIVDGKPTFVPGVATDFELQAIPGLVAKVVNATAGGGIVRGTISDSVSTYRYIAAPITVAGSADDAVFVAAIDVNARLVDLSSAFATYWEVVGLAFLVVASLGWYLSGRLLHPLTELRRTAARITSTHRSERIATRGNDDLAALGETVNGMLDRLDGAMTTQRQLLDDVRHELNTPISIVRGHLELLDARDAADVESVRSIAIEELDRLSTLVQGLATLAENEQLIPHRRVVDVGDFAREFFAKISVLPGHPWALGVEASGTALLDPGKITQAWLQLIDNAGKYSPAGSEIALGVAGDTERLEFWVLNTGPAIPEDARARIFERFGRIDTGRGIKGSGLGLAIVAAIARAHGGTVTLVSSASGTRFGVCIPRVAAVEGSVGVGEVP